MKTKVSDLFINNFIELLPILIIYFLFCIIDFYIAKSLIRKDILNKLYYITCLLGIFSFIPFYMIWIVNKDLYDD